MNNTTKTITAAALLLAIIGIGYAVITAQPPTTVRTVAAAPQGKWVALTDTKTTGTTGGAAAATGNVMHKPQTDVEYAVLFHTGTGKARIVKWNSSLDPIVIVESN